MPENRELLEAKAMHEIRTMLAMRGAGFSKTEKKTDLIDRLMLMDMTIQPNEKKKEEAVKAKKSEPTPAVKNTPEEIEKALESFVARGLVLTIDGDTWHVRRDTKSDSGHVTVPLRLIQQSAAVLMR